MCLGCQGFLFCPFCSILFFGGGAYFVYTFVVKTASTFLSDPLQLTKGLCKVKKIPQKNGYSDVPMHKMTYERYLESLLHPQKYRRQSTINVYVNQCNSRLRLDNRTGRSIWILEKMGGEGGCALERRGPHNWLIMLYPADGTRQRYNEDIID